MILEDSQVVHTKSFFDEIHGDYDDKSNFYLSSLEIFRQESSKYIKGNVLDIGNGGVISFDLEKSKKIIVADISLEMLKHLKCVKNGKFIEVSQKSVKCVQADVRDLPFKKNNFDTVLLLTTAHHLSEKSLVKTKQNIDLAFSEVTRVLKPGGKLILLECQLQFPFKQIQDMFFEFIYAGLIIFNKPLPYFLSEQQIKNCLTKHDLVLKKVKHLPQGKRTFLPLFPFFTFPGKWWDYISRSHIFVAEKKK